MIMPSKTVKLIDSLINISSYILDSLKSKNLTVDEIFEYINKNHYKKIDIEKLFFCLIFLYLIEKIEIKDAIIKIKFN